MKTGAFCVLLMVFLGGVHGALAQVDARQPGAEGARLHQRLSDEERAQRREQMRAMREMLIERQRREQAGGSVPVARPPVVPEVHEPGRGPGRARRETLRRLDPEERQRLRQEVRDAAREVYRR